MNESGTSERRTGQHWLTNKRVVCLVLILLATLYTVLQPKLEQWTGIDLPDVVQKEPDVQRDVSQSSSNRQPDLASETEGAFELRETGRNVFESPAGLTYTMGPNREHRIDHVMRHASDDPNRPVHGVFDANQRDDLLRVIDEAWQLIRADSPQVRQYEGDNGLQEYIVDLPTRIGFVGGQQGARQDNPETRRMKLILDGNRVITAYPTWPAR